MTAAQTEDLETKVKNQVEYYFGDSNFARDKFFREKANENPEGYIAVKFLLECNRLKKLTTDLALVLKSIKDSSVVVVNADSTMIKRKNPLPENDTSLARSIYSKGWPKTKTLDQVTEFYKPYGKVLSVFMRKNLNKEFKGSVTVEFSTEEEAKSALAAAPQPSGATLTYQTKDAWLTEKHQQRKESMEKKKAKQDAREKATPKPASSVLGIKGIDTNREKIKEVFSTFGNVKFIDYNKGEEEGKIRFETEEDARKAFKGMTESKKEVDGKVPELRILEGDELQEYWELVQSEMDNNKRKRKGNTKGKGNNRNGKGKGKGQKGSIVHGKGKKVRLDDDDDNDDEEDDERVTKKAKKEKQGKRKRAGDNDDEDGESGNKKVKTRN